MYFLYPSTINGLGICNTDRHEQTGHKYD